MRTDAFLFDYGAISQMREPGKRLTNPGELLWNDAWEALCLLCGLPQRQRSDYEAFCAIAEMLPLLSGHPMQKDFYAFWNTHFSDLPIPTEENAAALWRILSDRFFEAPVSYHSFLPRTAWNALVPSLAVRELPENACPMLNGDLLSATLAVSASAWHEELEELVEGFANAGCRQVRLSLPRELVFVSPDPYHVTLALGQKKKTEEHRSCLTAQLLRELCAVCRARELTLLLSVSCPADVAVALLQYAKERVGLPHIVLTSAERERICELPTVLLGMPASSCSIALPVSLAPSDGELEEMLAVLAARYPIERLFLITAGDALFLPHAQSRIAKCCEKIQKNL